MTRPATSTRRLYVPHVDGTLTGSPPLAGGQLPVLSDLTHAREFLGSYLQTHPGDPQASPPARPLAICEVDATITAQGRLMLPVHGDRALSVPHRQVVTVGPLQRPHPRALAVAYTVAWSAANATLTDPRLDDAAVRATNAVAAAWAHGHDVAYPNSWRALAAAADTIGYRLPAGGLSVRTPAPPPGLLEAAGRLAGSDQIVEVVEQAWRAGVAAGGTRGPADAALAISSRGSVLSSAATAITAEWTSPWLTQLASELARLGRIRQPERVAVLSRLERYLTGWQLADTTAARPTIRLANAGRPTPAARRLPPPPTASTSPPRGPTR